MALGLRPLASAPLASLPAAAAATFVIAWLIAANVVIQSGTAGT